MLLRQVRIPAGSKARHASELLCSLTLKCAKRSSWAPSGAGPVLCLLTACLNLNLVLFRTHRELESTPSALAFKSSFPQTASCKARDDKFTGEVCVSLLNSKPRGGKTAWILGPFILTIN